MLKHPILMPKFQKRTLDKVYSKEALDAKEKVLGEQLIENRNKV